MTDLGFPAIAPHGAMRVLVVGGGHPGGSDTAGAGRNVIQELDAVVSLARAVFAAGGEVVAIADVHLSPVLAAVAVDYAPQHAAEGQRRDFRLLTVVETGHADPSVRHLLAPYVERDVVRLVDQEGQSLAAPARWAEAGPPAAARERVVVPRHRVTPELLGRERLDGAVFVSVSGDDEAEMQLTEEHGIQISVVGETIQDVGVAERWADHDPTRRLLIDRPAELRWEQGREADDRSPASPVTPYPLVMQRLVAGWRRDR